MIKTVALKTLGCRLNQAEMDGLAARLQARGRARSLAFSDIVREAEGFASQGFKEIVLAGVNIGTYCSEENGRSRRFVDLVDRLQEIEGLTRRVHASLSAGRPPFEGGFG